MNSAEKSDLIKLNQLKIEDQLESNNRDSFNNNPSKNQISESMDDEIMRPSILGINQHGPEIIPNTGSGEVLSDAESPEGI